MASAVAGNTIVYYLLLRLHISHTLTGYEYEYAAWAPRRPVYAPPCPQQPCAHDDEWPSTHGHSLTVNLYGGQV